MRELRFRVWDKKKKCYLAVLGCSNLTIYQVARAIVERGEENIIIEQSTGVKDRNGKTIFEGDVVKGEWLYGTSKHIVKYKDYGYYPFTVMSEDGEPIILSTQVTVVGNVHEKPDLLKEEE